LKFALPFELQVWLDTEGMTSFTGEDILPFCSHSFIRESQATSRDYISSEYILPTCLAPLTC